jgi:very-short-patch-repair endonuclease
LAARRDVVVSHATAADFWRFKGFPVPEAIDLLSEGVWQPRLAGVCGHQSLLLPERDRTTLDRVPVTTPQRTLVDSCGLVPLPQLERATDDLLRRRLMRVSDLVTCFESVPVSGRRRSAPIRRLLVERIPGFHAGGSDRELDVMRILKRAGVFPLPRQQYRVKAGGKTYRLDFAWPETKHYIEFDGFDVHGSVSAFHADRSRLNALVRLGWRPLHATSRTSPSEIVAFAMEATASLADAS